MSDRHPLDPAGRRRDHARRGAGADRAGARPRVRVIFVEAREPDKADYHAWRADGAKVRARGDRDDGRLRARSRAAGRRSTSTATGSAGVTELDEGVQPAISGDEFFIAQDVMRADPRFREALAKRGIDDPEKVYVESWSSGIHEPGPRRHGARHLLAAGERHRQPVRPAAVRPGRRGRHQRARAAAPRRPRAGHSAAAAGGDYRNGGGRPYRSDVKPLEITQPDGPGFALDGHGVALAEVGAAHRLPSARGPRAARHRATTTRASGARSATAPRSPSW